MRIYHILFVLATVLLLGAEGCPQGTGTFSTGAGKYGIDFSPVSGIGYVSAGKTIYIDDIFNAKIHLENYDVQAHAGKLCMRDNIADAYGGISDECQLFQLKGAETIMSGGREQLQSSKTDILFPVEGEYSYTGIPIDQPAKIFVELQYVQTAKATGTINVPLPESEKIILEQTPAPITVGVEKTIRKVSSGYQIDLAITLTKSMSDAKIYSPEFSKENSLIISFNREVLDFKCSPDINQGILEFANTKFIRCSALATQETVSYPLIISLDYGVKITRSYDFNIKLLKEGMK